MMDRTVLDFARDYRRHGFSVVPIRTDGSKSPDGRWKCLATTPMSDAAANWLKAFMSVGFAHDFKVTLDAALQRFFALHHKACLICSGNDPRGDTATTTHVRYAAQRLMARHDELLREAYPDRDYRPDREELPEDLRLFETEFVDEYTGVERQFLDVVKYLKDISALIRSKMTARVKPEDGPSEGKSGPAADGSDEEPADPTAYLPSRWEPTSSVLSSG